MGLSVHNFTSVWGWSGYHRSIEMDMSWRAGVWRQFLAAIDMLDNALRACPDELWQERLYNERSVQPEFAEFWYIVYHTLFWLDFCLSDSAEGFAPPAPFTLSELEAGLLPERAYTKAELQAYLERGRNKCRAKLKTPADLLVPQHSRPDWPQMSSGELLLYSMRHVQEHAAQLSLFLGQKAVSAPGWVPKRRAETSAREERHPGCPTWHTADALRSAPRAASTHLVRLHVNPGA
jgi:hypothetical protein